MMNSTVESMFCSVVCVHTGQCLKLLHQNLASLPCCQRGKMDFSLHGLLYMLDSWVWRLLCMSDIESEKLLPDLNALDSFKPTLLSLI